jgi:hypothetical protein
LFRAVSTARPYFHNPRVSSRAIFVTGPDLTEKLVHYGLVLQAGKNNPASVMILPSRQ